MTQTRLTSDPKIIAKQTAASSRVNELYFKTDSCLDSIKICSLIISSQTALRAANSWKLFSKKHNLKVYANYVQCNLTRCFREGVYHDSSCFSRKRLFALQTSYYPWQGLKIATREIWLHNSLGSPRPVNEFRTISASIEQPESVFNILHTLQSEVILDWISTVKLLQSF